MPISNSTQKPSRVMCEALFFFFFQTGCSCPQTLSDLSVFIQQAQSSLKVLLSPESAALLLSASLSKESRDTRQHILSASVSPLHWRVEKAEAPASPWLPQGNNDRSGTRTHWKSGFGSLTNLGPTLPSSPSSVYLWTGPWTSQKPSVNGRNNANLIGGLWGLNELIYLKHSA